MLNAWNAPEAILSSLTSILRITQVRIERKEKLSTVESLYKIGGSFSLPKKLIQEDTEIVNALRNIKKYVEIENLNTKSKLDALEDAFILVCDISDRETLWRWDWWVRDVANRMLVKLKKADFREKTIQLLRKTYLLGARKENFDDFCVWMEIDRKPERRFYQPRRNSLLPLVNALQDLYDRKYEFLGVSMPPRVGKSTTCFFFLAFVFGHRPEGRSLCVSYSTSLSKNFFERLMDLISGEDYRWGDVFPGLKGITKKSIEDLSFDVKPKPDAFPTCICRGIDGALTGSCDCSADGIQYSDDLVRDYEESLSQSRLDMLWGKYVNQVRDRMHGAMQLMVGTRWNVFDPIGQMQRYFGDDPDYRFLVIPALNEKDESNFAYPRDGFSTEEYHDLRRITGDAEWQAKYMGRPYIREGLVFEPQSLRYYNGTLPRIEPDWIIAAVDVALGGGDSVSMPIAYVYGEDVFIPDVVFNNGSTDVTTVAVSAKIEKHALARVQFEENSGGRLYKDMVADLLLKKGFVTNLTSQRAQGEKPKNDRILAYSDEIKRRFIFLDEEHRNQEYRKFMQELCMYTSTGKNKHDDAPDSIAQLCAMLFGKKKTFRIAARPF